MTLKRIYDRLVLATGLGQVIGAETLRIYFLQFLALAIGMIGNIVVARSLGPGRKGIVDLFQVLTSLIQDIGALGFGGGLLFALIYAKFPLRSVHGTGIVFSLVNGAVTLTIGFVLISEWEVIFPGLPKWALYLCFAVAPLIYYKLVWSTILIGLNQAAVSYQVSAVLAGANLIAILGLFITGRLSVESVIVLTVSTIAVNVLISLWWLFRHEPGAEFDLSILKHSLGQGLIFYAGTIANLLHFKIDQILINRWYGSAEVGIYAVSVRWAELLFLLDSAVVSAALARLSIASESDSSALTRQMFRAQLRISGISALVLMGLAYPLVLFLYGRDYQGAVAPMICLVPGVLAWSVSKIFSTKLNYRSGKGLVVTFVAISGLFFNIVLNFIFLKVLRLGIVGASVASSFSYTLVLAAVWRLSLRDAKSKSTD